MAITHDAITEHDEHNAAPLEYSTEDGVLKILGFWIFLATDMILFACLFSMYQVLHTNVAGGPTEHQLYDVREFTLETIDLLVSSFTCGLATLEMRKGNRAGLIGWLVVTILLGMTFIGLELHEFLDYVSRGATLQRSGFLSSFFTLVGTHGCHVSMGILWMLSIIAQLGSKGINAVTARKVYIVGLYWHFLDIVWVFIFTIVYLQGVMA